MTLKAETAAKVMFSLLTEFSRDLSGWPVSPLLKVSHQSMEIPEREWVRPFSLQRQRNVYTCIYLNLHVMCCKSWRISDKKSCLLRLYSLLLHFLKLPLKVNFISALICYVFLVEGSKLISLSNPETDSTKEWGKMLHKMAL